MIFQKGIVPGVTFHDSNLHFLIHYNAPVIIRTDYGEHFRTDKRIGNDDAPLLAVIGAESYGEHTVDFAFGQRLQGGFRCSIRPGFKGGFRILFCFLRKRDIIRQGAHKFFTVLVLLAEGEKMIPIPYTDRTVLRQPFPFFHRKELVHGTGPVKLLGHLLVKIPVLFKNAVHGSVQIAFQIGTVLVNAKERFRKADFHHRHHIGRVAIGVQGHQHVDFTVFKHLQEFWSFCRQFYDIRVHIMFFDPLLKKLLLDTVLVNAHTFSIKGGKVVRPDFIVIGRNKDMISLRAHRFCGIEYLFRPLRSIRHIAEDVDFSRNQFFQQC